MAKMRGGGTIRISRFSRIMRIALGIGLCGCAAAAAMPAAQAQVQLPDIESTFTIAAGPAAQAIPEFARQANLTVLAASAALDGVRTSAVRGRHKPDEALAMLLAGTGLAARVKDNGSVLIAPAFGAASDAPPASASASSAAGPIAADGDGDILRFEPVLGHNSALAAAGLARLAGAIPKIVVSTRRSQQSAIERKKNAATAMDSIVAEDVGTLPDRNIGEALSRIAGVAIGRGEFGEGVGISIRGNGSALTRVELDGQGVRSAGGSDMNGGGDGRATEFRQLSTDLIRSVDVVKGATADMVEGSLGGSIVIKTRSSLEFDKPFVSLRMAGSRNSLNRKRDPDANLIMTRKFLDGRLGVLLNASSIRLTNESHQFQVSANGQDGYMRALDFDNAPQKTFSYRPETVDLADPASTTPWASYGGWNASTPLEIVTKSAAAQSKQDCQAAFPALSAGSSAIAGLDAANQANAINARNQEVASCLNQWNDTNPALLRYFVKRQIDDRKNLDLRTDFKVSGRLTLYAKGSFSRRRVDDNAITYGLGNAAVNQDAAKYSDSPAGVRTAIPDAGYYTFPDSFSLAAGGALLQGAAANIDPASVVVDANHHVTRYTLHDVGVGVDQIRNRMGTTTRYLQLGGSYRNGAFGAEFQAGDMRSHFRRGDQRTAWSYVRGDTTVSLQPNGIWAYAMPANTNLEDWERVAALQPAAGASQPQYTRSSPQITYSPQLRQTGERSARLDFTYALAWAPFFKRLKGGAYLQDSASRAWGSGGYTVTPAVGMPGQPGYVPAVTVPANKLASSFVGCADTPGSLGPGGTPCAHGVNAVPGSRNYQIVLTQQAFRDAILGAMYAPATPTRLFDGAAGRPDALVGNWTQIDVEKVFAAVGARNLGFDCMKTCTGSDGKAYEQPQTAVRERSSAAYLMADFGLERIPFTERALPFGWELEGNMGWRYVRTSVRGTGNLTFISTLKTARFDPANPGAPEGSVTTQVSRNTTIGAVTHDFLPAYNLALWLAPDRLVLRYGHARAVARPGASKLVAAGTCTYDETRVDANGDPDPDATCATIGNPALRAQASVNRNLGLEWYPDKDTMFSAAAWRQVGRTGAPVIDGISGRQVFAGSVLDPAGRALAAIPFDIRTWVNGPPATRTGIEFGAKAALTFLPWRLRHTGIDANFTRQRSNQARVARDLLSGAALAPQGEPKYSTNWALWYDDGRWQARVAVQTVGAKLNCIAPCGDNPVGYALNAYPNAGLAWKTPAYNPGPPNYTDRTRYVDGKIAWRWRRNLEFFIEARNLTNQTQTSSIGSSPYADGTPNLQNYYYPGRRITVGLVLRNL